MDSDKSNPGGGENMILEILTGLNFLIFISIAYMFYLITRMHKEMEDAIFKFNYAFDNIKYVETKIKSIEVDFLEKFDYTLRKLQSRMAMRKRREEDEEEQQNLNSPIVGI